MMNGIYILAPALDKEEEYKEGSMAWATLPCCRLVVYKLVIVMRLRHNVIICEANCWINRDRQ